jgi:hypothetical protein
MITVAGGHLRHLKDLALSKYKGESKERMSIKMYRFFVC